jgi:hypothetical protein
VFGKIVKNIADELNIVVQRQFNDVYSIRESELHKKLDELIYLYRENNKELVHLNGFLHALTGANSPPRVPGGMPEEVRRYAEQIQNSIGGVVDGLPEPPASLTGRRRGTT